MLCGAGNVPRNIPHIQFDIGLLAAMKQNWLAIPHTKYFNDQYLTVATIFEKRPSLTNWNLRLFSLKRNSNKSQYTKFDKCNKILKSQS